MQLMVVMALDQYNFKSEATRIASKYLDLVSKNYKKPNPQSYINSENKTITRRFGQTYEKYKVDGSINDDEYKASVMMGWTAGSFTWCFNYLQKK